MVDGVRSNTVPVASTADSVLVNSAQGTGRLAVATLGSQLLGQGPVSEELAQIRSEVTSGLVTKATFSDLQAVLPAEDGTGGEVLDDDQGTHNLATATGYNGAQVPNAGRYSFNTTWQRWLRIGDSGLSSKVSRSELEAEAGARERQIDRQSGVIAVPFLTEKSQPLISPISNPTVRYDSFAAADEFIFDLRQAAVLHVGARFDEISSLPQRKYMVRMSFDSGGVAPNSNAGLCIGFDPATDTGDETVISSDARGWTWRQNGVIIGGDFAGGGGAGAVDAAYAFSLSDGQVPTFVAGDDLALELVTSADGATGTLRGYKNDVLAFTGSVGAVPAGKLLCLMRGLGGGGAYPSALRGIFDEVSAGALPDPVDLASTVAAPYVEPGAPAGGNGTEDAPFQTLSDALASVDENANDLTLTIKPGILTLANGISFDPNRWRTVRIRGQQGDRPILRGSQAAGVWTQASGQATVWSTPHLYNGAASSVSSGGVMRLDDDTVEGVPVRAFKRLAPNLSPAAMAAETVPASSVNTSEGRMYVVLPDGANPSTQTLHLVQCDNVVRGLVPGANDWRQSELVLEGLRIEGGYIGGVQAGLWRLSTDDTAVAGTTLDGWSVDECSATLLGGGAYGCGNDGVNMNPVVGGPGLTDPTVLTSWDFSSVGHVQGDGWSNHRGGGLIVCNGGRVAACGKDGFSMGQGGTLRDVLLEDCQDTGVKLYDEGVVTCKGLQMTNCERGTQVVRSTGTGVSRIALTGGAIIGGDRALYTFNQTGNPALAVIDAYGVGTSGQTTAAVSNNGGTINRVALDYV